MNNVTNNDNDCKLKSGINSGCKNNIYIITIKGRVISTIVNNNSKC